MTWCAIHLFHQNILSFSLNIKLKFLVDCLVCNNKFVMSNSFDMKGENSMVLKFQFDINTGIRDSRNFAVSFSGSSTFPKTLY